MEFDLWLLFPVSVPISAIGPRKKERNGTPSTSKRVNPSRERLDVVLVSK